MLGLFVLKNFKKSRTEKIITSVSVVVYVVAAILGVVFNAKKPIPSCDTARKLQI